jgi:hypothetical protein
VDLRQNATDPKAAPRGDFVPDPRSNCEKKVDGYDTRLKEECNCRRVIHTLNFSVIPDSKISNIKHKMVLASSG